MRSPRSATKISSLWASAMAAAALLSTTEAVTVTFANQCSYTINLYDNQRTEDIASGGSTTRELGAGFSGMFRHGRADQATLAEFAMGGGRVWYDISVIPPGPGHCKSFHDCKQVTNRKGYNVPMAIVPQTSATTAVCRTVTCEHEQCEDAYLYPSDDTKTRSCTDSTPLKVVFCPSGSAQAPAPAPAPTTIFDQAADYESGVVSSTTAPPTATPTPDYKQRPGNNNNQTPTVSPTPTNASPSTPANNSPSSGANGASFPGATIKSSFKYSGKTAGNMPGTYDMVTNTQGCQKQKVTVNSPVGPLSEEVSMVFRGPMEIYNIAVFDGSAGGDWKKVSSYSQNGEIDNMVFLNNKNVDYVTGVKSPQGLSSRDGLSLSSTAQHFSGVLAEATNPGKIGGGPGISTGAEVNIMTATKCSADNTCKGYYDDNGYHGWNGGKKMFVTKVKMPTGSSPNQPAIWMLNAQILRSNQYGCNCRGMGGVGGCGELDIAEVIETNNARDKVTTHYYFYDGSVPAGYDNFAPRPTNAPTTYITIIDDSGDGTIKIIELGESDFDFSVGSVSASQVAAWKQ